MVGSGGVLDLMHGRSRMTIYPRIPTMPGRSTSGFFTDQADIDCTKREAKREVSSESREGWVISFYLTPLVRLCGRGGTFGQKCAEHHEQSQRIGTPFINLYGTNVRDCKYVVHKYDGIASTWRANRIANKLRRPSVLLRNPVGHETVAPK